MVDREDIPEKVNLENAERAPRGDDPLVRFEEDDFSAETKQKIGDYFRQEIVDGNKSSQAEIQDTPNLKAFQDSAESSNAYLSKQTTDARGSYEKIGNSGQFARDIIPGDKGDVDAETELQASGLLTILKESPNLVGDEVNRNIETNALHSPDNRFVDDNRPAEEDSGAGRHVIQSRFGTHSPQKTFRNAEEDPSLTIKNLRNLGCQILLEASGEAFVPEDLEDPAQLLAAQEAVVVPGLARLGFRVDANRFGAREVVNNVNGDIRKPEVEISLDGPAKPTFGSVNNPLVPFSAITSGRSSVAAGGLLVATFSTIFRQLSALLQNANPGSKNETEADITSEIGNNKAELSKRRLGSYVPKTPEYNGNSDFGLALLGLNQNLLVRTDNDYEKSVQKGVEIFFGLDTSTFSTGFDTIDDSAKRIVESPGFYNGVLRLLVRSISDPLSQIVGNVQGLAGGKGNPTFTTGPADYDPIIGPARDPGTLIESIRVLKESKFLKFMNVLANIGDIALMISDRIVDESSIDSVNDVYEEPSLSPEGQSILAPNPAALVRRSRLSNRIGNEYNNSLAWGANTLPSLYMINRQILDAEELYGLSDNYNALSTKRNYELTDEKRLPGEFVDEIEKRLDAYYMPFYFHDLRTNEIIAFHAFLENISDSHTTEYNEGEGYGRIGKVYSYKNTNRSISVSFKIVAVNPDDFDAMWYKINKLLMMLYPQYTLGRSVSFDSKKFIQPFSQLPSASPMIRLRVGDLIKTNFSEFDLARLFGLGSSKFQISDSEYQANQDAQRRIREKFESIRKRQLGDNENPPQFNQGEFFIINEKIMQIGSRQSQNQKIRRIGEPGRGVSAARLREIQKAAGARRSGGIPDVPIGAKAVVNKKVANQEGVYQIQFIPALAGEQQGATYEINLAAVNIKIDQTSVSAQARKEVSGEAGIQALEETAEEVANFFNPDDTSGGSTRSTRPQTQQASTNGGNGATGNAQGAAGGNPIFQAFRTTRGKGLAGFLKNLNFNWEGAVWETEARNSKAPRICQVDFEFAPVHDLNPGLDSNGNMIAPIYNIGAILDQMKVKRARAAEEQSEAARTTASDSSASPNQGSTPDNQQ